MREYIRLTDREVIRRLGSRSVTFSRGSSDSQIGGSTASGSRAAAPASRAIPPSFFPAPSFAPPVQFGSVSPFPKKPRCRDLDNSSDGDDL